MFLATIPFGRYPRYRIAKTVWCMMEKYGMLVQLVCLTE